MRSEPDEGPGSVGTRGFGRRPAGCGRLAIVVLLVCSVAPWVAGGPKALAHDSSANRPPPHHATGAARSSAAAKSRRGKPEAAAPVAEVAGGPTQLRMTWTLSQWPAAPQAARQPPVGPTGRPIATAPADPAGAPGASRFDWEGTMEVVSLYGWIVALVLSVIPLLRRRRMPMGLPPPGGADAAQAGHLPSRAGHHDHLPRHAESAPQARAVHPGAAGKLPDPAQPEGEDLERIYASMTEVLVEHLQQHPKRTDLWLKLLEMTHAKGNAQAFVRHVESMIVSIGRDPMLWPTVVRIGRELAPEHPLFRERPTLPQAPAGPDGTGPA